MKVKRYIASDLQEAMIKIKNELGIDAVILHSRKVKKPGLKGLLGRHYFEVVAAVDDEEPAVVASSKPAVAKEDKPEEKVQNPELDKVSQEVNELKKLVSELVQSKLPPATPAPVPPSPAIEETIAEEKAKSPEEQLVDYGIDRQVAKEIIAHLPQEGTSTPEDLKGSIKSYLGAPNTIENATHAQNVYFFVGPTGVGKTTTLAKLAARLSLIHNKKVGLITADTYRIAAVEQLKTYSEILNIPIEVVYEHDELSLALRKFKDKDYILVDTAGRSHRSVELREDLEGLLSCVSNPKIFLVMSLTTSLKDLKAIIKSYDFVEDFELLFTKLDETSSVENIVNIKGLTKKRLSYLTVGQSVPDDIEVADLEKISSMIVGELNE